MKIPLLEIDVFFVKCAHFSLGDEGFEISSLKHLRPLIPEVCVCAVLYPELVCWSSDSSRPVSCCAEGKFLTWTRRSGAGN